MSRRGALGVRETLGGLEQRLWADEEERKAR